MTLGTRPPVVHRAQTAVDIVDLFVNLLIEGKGVAGGLFDPVTRALRARIPGESRSVKARGRFGCGLLRTSCQAQGHHAEKQKKGRNALPYHRVILLENGSATARGVRPHISLLYSRVRSR